MPGCVNVLGGPPEKLLELIQTRNGLFVSRPQPHRSLWGFGCQSVCRIQGQRLIEVSESPFPIAFLHAGEGTPDVRSRGLWRKMDRLIVIRDGQVLFTPLHVDFRSLDAGGCTLGSELESGGKIGKCLVGLTETEQSFTPVVEGFDFIGIEAQRFGVVGNRFGPFA